MIKSNERADAYRVLHLWLTEGAFIKESGLSPFAMELALGVCRRHLLLEYFIKTLTKKMPPLEEKVILEMGLFQMFFMDVPDHAAISTSVELAKAASLGEGATRLTNAVLRAARRSGLPQMPPQRVRRISIENSVPEWIVRRWFDVYGGDKAETLAKATLERPTEWLRVNLQKTTTAKLAEALGFGKDAVTLYDRYIQVPRDASLKTLLNSPEFSAGHFSLQNPAAFEVVKLLDAKPGMSVWDACAAPGGKTALLAEMDGSLRILASDSSETRLEKMQDLMTRLGITNVNTECIDITTAIRDAQPAIFTTREKNATQFDRILLDVPCSNMGVISRRPESIYRLSPESIMELSELQFQILENAAKALKPDGRLVYATCSPDPQETTQVINRFLKVHPDFKKVGDAVLPGDAVLLGDANPNLDRFFAQALEHKP
ncbi:MAG: RNA methyltransferase [Fibrobacter sp.]|nr:RNA methyltransferase [Fibrobacter sp.]